MTSQVWQQGSLAAADSAASDRRCNAALGTRHHDAEIIRIADIQRWLQLQEPLP